MATPDISLIAGLDTSQAIRDAAKIPSLVKPIKLRVDSAPLGHISKDVNEFSRSLNAATSRTVAFAASASALYGVSRAFREISKATIEVEKQLKDINVVLSLSQGQLTRFSKDLFTVANQTSQSFKTASSAALEFSRQGLSTQEVLKRTKDALNLVRFSGIDATDAVQQLTAAVNTYGDAQLDTTAITERLVAVDQKYAISAGGLVEALSRSAASARDAKVPFNELLGLITSLRQTTGREASVVGNSIKSIFTKITRSSTIDELREIGVLTEDYSGKVLSATQILGNLARQYDSLSESQRGSISELVGGLYQINQLKAAMSDLSKENSIYAGATRTASEATDEITKRSAELNKTLSSQLQSSLNNLTQFAAGVGKLTLEPVFSRIFGSINEFSNQLNSENISAGDKFGLEIGKGMLRGIGNYLSGPGLALGGILLGKLFLNFASFTSKALGQVLEGVTARAGQEAAINNLLQKQPQLYTQINNLGNNQVAIQKLITAELIKQIALENERARVASSISALTTRFPLSLASNRPFKVSGQGEGSTIIQNPKIRTGAVGLVPQIQETLGAIKGGYKPGQIKELNVPNLGKVVYNSAEKVKRFPGLSQPAIIPPQNSKAGLNYKKTFTATHGFNPYKSDGLVPNFLNTSLLKPFRQVKNQINSGDFGIFNSLQDTNGFYNSIDKRISLNKNKLIRGNQFQNTQSLTHEGIHNIFDLLGNKKLNSNLAKQSINFENNESNTVKRSLASYVRTYFKSKDYKSQDFLEEAIADGSLQSPFDRSILNKYLGLNDKQLKSVNRLYGRLQNAAVSGLKLRGFPSGLVPAIAREHAAGIPLSQIRVGSSPRIKSSFNPAGLGVYNKIDEPLGLNQGINRVAAMGYDPKKAGIPNYAAGDLFKENFNISQSGAGQLYNLDLKNLNQDINKYRIQIKLGQRNQTEINKAIDSLKKEYNLNKDAVTKITKSFTTLYAPVLNQQKQFQNRTTELKNQPFNPLLFPYSPNQATTYGSAGGQQLQFNNVLNPQSRLPYVQNNIQNAPINTTQESSLRQIQLAKKLTEQQVRLQKLGVNGRTILPNSPEYKQIETDILRRLQATATVGSLLRPTELSPNNRDDIAAQARSQRQRINNLKSNPLSFVNGSFSSTGFNSRLPDFGVLDNSRGLYNNLTGGLSVEQRQVQSFQKQFGNAAIYRPFQYKKALDYAKNNNLPELGNQLRGKVANQALLGSFALPAIAGIGEQSILNSGLGNSTGGRGLARSVGGLGNIGSYALTGLGLSNGHPIGAAIGGGAGLLLELPSILKSFTDVLPDLERNLEKVKEKTTRLSTSLSEYVNISSGISENTSQTENQKRLLLTKQQEAFAQIDSPFKKDLRGLINQGKIGDAQILASKISEQSESELRRKTLIKDLVKERDIKGATLGEFNRARGFDKVGAGADYLRGNLFKDYFSRDGFGKFGSTLQSIDPLAATGKFFRGLGRASTANSFSGALSNFGNTSLSKESLDTDRLKFIGQATTSELLGSKNKNLQSLSELLLDDKNLFSNVKNGNFNNSTNNKSLVDNVFKTLTDKGFDVNDLQGEFNKSVINASGNDKSGIDKGIKEFLLSLQKITKSFDDTSILTNIIQRNFIDLNKVSQDFSNSLSESLANAELSGIKNIGSLEGRLNKSFTNLQGNNRIRLLNAPGNNRLSSFLESKENEDSILNQQKLDLTRISEESSGNRDNLRKTFLESLQSDILDKSGNKVTDTSIKEKAIQQINDLGILKDKIFTPQQSSQDIKKVTSYLDALSQLPNADLKQFDFNGGQISSSSQQRDAISFIRNLGFNDEQLKRTITAAPNIIGQGFKYQSSVKDSELDERNKISQVDIKGQNEYENNRDKLLNNLKFFTEQTRREGILGSSVSNLNINNISESNILRRQSLISNPFKSLEIQKQIEKNSSKTEILGNLRSNLPTDDLYQKNDIDTLLSKQKEITDDTLKSSGEQSLEYQEQLGYLEQIKKAKQETLNKDNETNALFRERRKDLELQLKFSANRLSAQKERNTNLAAQGEFKTLLGKENTLNNVFGGLEFSREEFFADMSNNVQEFSVEFKDSIKQGFATAIKNGKDLKGALEDSLLDFATNQLVKTTSLAIDGIFGALTSKLNTGGQSGGNGNVIGSIISGLGSAYANSRAKGGYIPKFAKGGYVNMGSGTKDDVPAFLSGGEFVLKKSAVNKIGKQNLDILNNTNDVPTFAKGGKFRRGDINSSGAITKDSFNITGNSAQISLANSYEFNNKGKRFKGISNTSPLLSAFALTDENNPQNKLRFSREQYVLGRREFEKNKRKGLAEYEKNQKTSYYIAFGSALVNAAGSAYAANNSGTTSDSTGNLIDAPNGTTYSTITNSAQRPGTYSAGASRNYTYYGRKNGGHIPHFEKGGQYVGGDSQNDRFAAMVQGGEYIIKPETVQKKGISYFNNLNNLGNFSAGGYAATGGNYDSSSEMLSKVSEILEQIRDSLDDKNKPNANKKENNSSKSSGSIINFTSNITINREGKVENSTKSGEQDEKAGNGADQETAKRLNKFIEAKITEFIIKEIKDGGSLSNKFEKKR